ncbi:uncharacterized protein BDCG_17150 [Blastomyces dermatitidis ER-3]|uniref:Uncharacterized protein n=2 Tax=Ajellomyces dermatitidis TaxID=5039 RepID=A0A0J9EQE9_AJEDA|nr:uncharacterized protein BDCG_17150 [Blastomyces dermatitidis ER-3]EQL28369.1 hypothetical protein BDFG_08888 [Blastomyces dermatitidis ATCC 26199]KMW68236.1 hypothetical protein BDDG_12674 [Blastomyces dermatitidis ATCC 18188]OAT01590.1 hypothetical protein BDCG_17150 [Blastomyces dermatitidis ER-3]
MATTATAPQYLEGDTSADFGDFVSTQDEELDFGEVMEPWKKYDEKDTAHVLYPICLGQELNERDTW